LNGLTGSRGAVAYEARLDPCQRGLTDAPIRSSVGVSWGFKWTSAYPPKCLHSHLSKSNGTELTQSTKQDKGVLALVQQAANISKENADRAMSMAHRLSLELRAAEDRIAELQAETERLQTRAARAEQWLEAIKNEIDSRFQAAAAT
jgi:hypothetical protein